MSEFVPFGLEQRDPILLKGRGVRLASIYCDGIKDAYVRDGLMHITWFVEQRRQQQVIPARVVLPTTALVRGGVLINEALSRMWQSFDGLGRRELA